MRSWLSIILVCIALSNQLFTGRTIASGKDLVCHQFPQAGHRVNIVDLHPSDTLYLALSELNKLQMVLMEPGVCINNDLAGEGGPWFRARLFIIEGKTESFSNRDVIIIEAGKFK